MVEHIIYLGAAIGGVAMPFSRSRSRATWSRWVIFTLAGLFFCMAVCGFAVDLHYWDFSEQWRRVFRSYMQVIRGFIMGCSFVLFVSGDLVGKKILKDEDVA
jgi:hypothetical protein